MKPFIKIPWKRTNIGALPIKERIRVFQLDGCNWKEAKERYHSFEKTKGTMWQNGDYCVDHHFPNELPGGDVREWKLRDKLELLSIKRVDKEPIRDWPTLQRIKNTILPDGDKRYAIEIFPPESRLVDTANQYWLWVFPVDFDIGIGFMSRAVIQETKTTTFVPSNGDKPITTKQTYKETA